MPLPALLLGAAIAGVVYLAKRAFDSPKSGTGASPRFCKL